MKKIIFLFAAISLIAYSCSKDQKVVRQLEGDWKVTALKYNGIPADAEEYENTTYTFEKCNVSKEDCPGKMTTSDPSKGSISYDFTYSITDKGDKITINLNVFGFTSSSTSTIEEHSKTKFVWTTTQDGEDIETTIEKK